MSRTLSTMLPLGTPLPAFSLADVVSGRVISPDHFKERKALLVMFICKHCPYVIHIQQGIAHMARDYASQSVGIIAITSNDVEKYQEDSPAESKKMAETLGFAFPFCYDESQEAAIAFNAACTPEFYVFDEKRLLVYRGQFDDSRRGNDIPVTGRDVRNAMDAVLNGTPINPQQIPSIGCNIKWKPGNEPEYHAGG
jgi:peroxiredoxin